MVKIIGSFEVENWDHWKKEMSELSGVSFGGVINNKQNNK